MEKRLCFLLLFGSFVAGAQKMIKKTIVQPEVSFVSIDAANCFRIEVETVEGNEMTVEARIDGEYYQNLLVGVKEEGSALEISAGFHPSFAIPNDKLSAHKVVSVALKIQIPQNKHVQLFGTSSNVEISGRYKKFDVSLNDGRCYLKNVSENVVVNTQSGNIYVISNGAQVNAFSKFGTVSKNGIPKGNSTYALNTITGDIQLSKTE